jgi:pyroglutamyl-peptidase
VKRLLILGFGPFPRVPRNPAGVLAARLGPDPVWRRRGVEATAIVLPTAYSAIPGILEPLIRETAFDAVLLIGVAARRRVLSVEVRAVNRVSRLFPDASGRVGARLTYDRHGPFQRRAGVEPGRILRAIQSAGPKARLSIDAGRYLCNATYYAALAFRAPRVVFIHVPLPRRVARDGRPSLGEMERALRAAALALLPSSDPPRARRR